MSDLPPVSKAAYTPQSGFFGANASGGGGGSGPMFVHAASNWAVGTSVTVSINVSSGNLVWVFTEDPGAQSITVADGVNTYTNIDAITTGGLSATSWYAKNVTGGTLNIVATPSSTASLAVTVMELSGCSPASPLDTFVSTFNGSGTLTSGAFTTSTANTIIVMGGSNFYGSGIVWSAGSIGTGVGTIPSGATAGGGDTQGNVSAQYLPVNTVQTGITSTLGINLTVYGTVMAAAFK